MTNDERLLELAQQIYRARNGQKKTILSGEETDFIDDAIDWVNQFIPELDLEAYWNWVRTNDDIVGTVVAEQKIYSLGDNIRTLVINPQRDLSIRHDGNVISTFKMVNANQLNDPSDYDVRDRATVIGRKLVLSRAPTEQEAAGDIVADSVAYLPKLSHDDVTLLDTVDPIQLVVLGVLKNEVLPDIVQGGLTPSFTQKYGDLLQKCIAENNLSAAADEADRENLSFVGGVW